MAPSSSSSGTEGQGSNGPARDAEPREGRILGVGSNSGRRGQAMPTRDLTVHVYEAARHEVLNEANRDEVIGHLADWIERISPA